MSETDFPAPEPKRPTGGYRYHRPGCICIACRAARKRAEEAEPGATGSDSAEAPSQAVAIKGDGFDGLYSTANKPDKTAIDADVPFRINARTHRDRIAQWIALKTANPKMTNVEIAKKLGLAPNTLSSLISRARKAGWLTFDNPLDRIEHEIVPKVLDNMNMFLDRGDKLATIEAMKGFIVPSYKEAKGITEQPSFVLALKIEMPDGDPSLVPRGTIAGAPRLTLPAIDVEAVEVESTS